ncbi:MAG: DUF58 domain-containing protein [Clostridia bacterium]|nr:DUF58 domain-containing protein [Clostridia bacterium]
MKIIAFMIIVFAAIQLQKVVFTALGLKKLEYMCGFSENEAHEGDEVFLVETVHNKKLLPVPWLKVDIHSSRWLEFAGVRSVITQDNRRVTSSFLLKSYQKVTRRWNLRCLKRGVFFTENVTLIWGDILGIGNDSAAVPVNARLIVYPEILNLEDMFIPANYVPGDTIVKRWIVDDPFMVSGAREYTERDPMNRVHWQATARHGKLMVRKSDFTSQLSLTVILNMQSVEYEYDRVMYRDKAELGIKVAATVLDRAARMGIPARLISNGHTVHDDKNMVYSSEAGGIEHIRGLMKILAELELKNLKDFDNFLEGVIPDIANSQVVLITSYMNRQTADSARYLRQNGNAVKIVLLDYISEAGKLPGDIDLFMLSGVDNIYA